MAQNKEQLLDEYSVTCKNYTPYITTYKELVKFG